MFHTALETIRTNFSGDAAKEHVADIIRHHRIQASPGYRAAAQQAHQKLVAWGLNTELLSFPADETTRFWAAPAFQEWMCHGARLELIAPEDQARTLADYSAAKLAVIQRSAPWAGEAEVAVLEDGADPNDYTDVDVQGKIVVSRGSLDRVRQLACSERGAVGIIYDGMNRVLPVRDRWDLPDALQYTSFWWAPQDEKTFGFVVSPRAGDELRRLVKQCTEKGEGPVLVRGHVNTEFHDGAIEVLTATIPGQAEGEVWVVSHLCHPQPSANDNASGAATGLELARTLHDLIEAGDLNTPHRTIRFIWMPEMMGTYAFLATHEHLIPTVAAAINLDMVGEDHDQTGSSFLIIGSPDATPSFVDVLTRELFEAVSDDAPVFSGDARYPLFLWTNVPYAPGSDHYILADPSVGIPCPMLIQWPDKFYHTSYDTLDRVSPAMLARAGAIAGAYAYFLAVAGAEEAIWLAQTMLARFKQESIDRMHAALTETMAAIEEDAAHTLAHVIRQLERRTAYESQQLRPAFASLHRLVPDLPIEVYGDAAERFANEELARTLATIGSYGARRGIDKVTDVETSGPDAAERKSARLVPRRRHRGPVDMAIRSHRHRLSPEDRDRLYQLAEKHTMGAPHLTILALYRADGERNLAEIVDPVELETGQRELELLLTYFELLAQMELIDLIQPSAAVVADAEM